MRFVLPIPCQGGGGPAQQQPAQGVCDRKPTDENRVEDEQQTQRNLEVGEDRHHGRRVETHWDTRHSHPTRQPEQPRYRHRGSAEDRIAEHLRAEGQRGDQSQRGSHGVTPLAK
ncbi:MAG: hypothetical protein NTX51_13340 [Verrucomicrobia bacterium]|nr:hypothetical protein [Verrucomicrobiota bacterium]